MNHTTRATIAAGRKNSRTFAMNTITRKPTIKRINKIAHSRSKGTNDNPTPPS